MNIASQTEASSRLEEIVEEIEAHLDYCLADPEELVITSETFSDWEASRKSWNEQGTVEAGQAGDIPFVKFENVQIAKGMAREVVTVYDLGGVRLVDRA